MTRTPGERDVVSALEADLVALAAADADLERDAEVAERTRIERGQQHLADRLRGVRGYVHLAVLGGAHVDGPVLEVGDGWVVVGHVPPGHGEPTSAHLVRLDAVLTVSGLDLTATSPGRLPARSLASLLRAWCRDRSDLTLTLVDGSRLAGRASAAYADHLEVVAEHGSVAAVPYAALASIGRAHLL